MKLLEETVTIETAKELSKNNLYIATAKHINKNIIKLLNNKNEIVCVALISLIHQYNSKETLENFLESLKAYNLRHYEKYVEDVLPLINKCVYINYIESVEKNKGYATLVVNYLKSTYKKLWLYSILSAEYYWIKQGFENLGEDCIYGYGVYK